MTLLSLPGSAAVSEGTFVSRKPDADEEEPGVRKERIEGELKEIEDTKEKETVKEDGTHVKTTTKTISHVQIVTEVTTDFNPLHMTGAKLQHCKIYHCSGCRQKIANYRCVY